MSDVVTYEFENVPAESTRFLADAACPCTRRRAALEAAQDRLAEKTLFTEVGLPVPAFAAVDDLATLDEAIAAIGLPAVLKTRRLGYDGKGQAVLRDRGARRGRVARVGEVPSLLEAFVPFDRELSIVGVRAATATRRPGRSSRTTTGTDPPGRVGAGARLGAAAPARPPRPTRAR